jgi:4-amino-4-deoxy-L-arabinose transferase-like glycosyltransferase
MMLQNFKKNASFFSDKNWGISHLLWISLLAIVWLGSLGWRHLIPSDEGRYAEIAREMLVNGNWIVPRYNGYLYFEKPPLQMWATALTFQVFGLGEWQARLWTGLTSFFSILLVGFTVYKVWGIRAGTITALVLASSPLWIIGGHFNSLDMGIAFFMSAALCSLILALHATEKSREEQLWMLTCWAMMALSVLSKGLIGIVLPGLVLIIYSITGKDSHSWKRMYWLRGAFTFFLITTPWFVLIAHQHASFIDFFFIHEHFERFTKNEHQRSAPWHFFIPLILIGILPWLLHLPRALLIGFKSRQGHSNSFKPLWLCFTWVICITVFFSLSNSKLPGYIFPVIPALAILMGYSIWLLIENNHQLNPLGIKIWIIQLLIFEVIFLIGLFFVPKIASTGEVYEAQGYATYAKIIGVSLLIGLLGCFLAWIYRKNAIKSILLFSNTMIVVSLTAGTGHEIVGRVLSGYDLALKAKPVILKDDPLYGVRMLDHTVPFYLEHPLIMVDFKDELAFGISQEPEKWIPTLEEWMALWLANPNKKEFALMTPGLYQELLKKNLPMEVVAEDPLRIIISKPTKK